MKLFGFITEAHHGNTKNNKNKQKTATATTRKSPGQICVSSADKTAKQHKTGPEAEKNHTNPWG